METKELKKENLIIDFDPGVDDAIAFMMGVEDTQFNIQLCSVLAGNLGIEMAKTNALHMREFLNKTEIPVIAGAEKPLKKPISNALNVHGKYGLGNHKFKKSTTFALDTNLNNYIMGLLKKNGKSNTTFLTMGPLTNMANLLVEYPECKKYIKQIVFMGGSTEPVLWDNETNDYKIPYAEFNINFDPDAAKIVVESGVDLVMVPMEMGHTAYLNKDDIKKTKKMNEIGKIYAAFYKYYIDGHVPNGNAATHDACAIAYLIDENIFETKKAKIKVCIDKLNCATISCDFETKTDFNATVCTKIDVEKFKEMYFKALSRYNKKSE